MLRNLIDRTFFFTLKILERILQAALETLDDLGKSIFDLTAIRHSFDAYRGRNGLQAIDHLIDSFVLERRDLNDRAAELLFKRGDIDLIAAFAHHIHHVDRNNHRDAHFEQLSGQIEIAFKVGAIDDVQDGIRVLLDQEITCDNLFKGVGGK